MSSEQNNNKKRPMSPQNDQEKEVMKKSKDNDELDTPTKLMIDQFLKFDHT